MTKKLTTARELHDEWMQDPEYVAAWEASAEEFAWANALIEARSQAHMTQEQVAEKIVTLAIARGELKPHADDSKVWFTSPESFARVLSNKNRLLLDVISSTHPESLQDLAASTGRKTRTCRACCGPWNVTVSCSCTGACADAFDRRCRIQSIALEMVLVQ